MKKWVGAALLLVALAAVLEWRRPRYYPVDAKPQPHVPKFVRNQQAVASEPIGAAQAQKSRVSLLMEGKLDRNEYALQPHEVEEFLRQNRTNAHSLITAFAATHDREYLRQAGRLFPEDSFVQAQMLMHDVFPEERQKWLEAFKASAPDNAFPNMLSARERLRAGDIAGAMAEVAAAQGKPFEDYTRRSMVALTEAYMSAGRPVAEANVAGSAEILLPHLAQIKEVSAGLLNYARENPANADAARAAVWQIGSLLREDGGGGILLTDAVGVAIQNLLLGNWPPDRAAPFLEGTVEEQLAANRAHREQVQMGTALFDAWLPNAPEHEIIAYIERIKAFGEWDALNWLRGRHPELAQVVRPQ